MKLGDFLGEFRKRHEIQTDPLLDENAGPDFDDNTFCLSEETISDVLIFQ